MKGCWVDLDFRRLIMAVAGRCKGAPCCRRRQCAGTPGGGAAPA